MQMTWSREELAFRDEVRAFLDEKLRAIEAYLSG